MEADPADTTGVEESGRQTADTDEVRELLDALAYPGIRHLELTAQNLLRIQAQLRGNLDLLKLVTEIRSITRLAEQALRSAGYPDESIHHVPKSEIRPKPPEGKKQN